MNTSLIDKLQNYFVSTPVAKAWVFGSFARNEEDEDSDLDLLIDFNAGHKITLFGYAHLVNEIQKLTHKKVDLVENGHLRSYAQKSAEQDKILIYERKD